MALRDDGGGGVSMVLSLWQKTFNTFMWLLIHVVLGGVFIVVENIRSL